MSSSGGYIGTRSSYGSTKQEPTRGMRPDGYVATLCVAAAGLLLAAAPAQAIDSTWTGPGVEWTTGTNWSSSPIVPTGTATFTNSSAPASVTISNSASIDTIQFTTTAPAFAFTVATVFATL